MKITEKKSTEKKKNFIGKAFVGIDVHKTSWKVCLLGEGGFKKEFSCDAEFLVLKTSLENCLPNFSFECCYEAGFSGFWLADKLNNTEGFSCIIVNPADIPTSDKERAQKEDRRDARKIATQLKAGSLKGIYIPKTEEVYLRELQRLRYTLTKDLTRSKARIKSFLNRHGIQPSKEEFSSANKHWSGRFIKWLKEIDMGSPAAHFALNQLIKNLINLRDLQKETLLEIRKQIKTSAKEEMYLELIKIDGIGEITSTTIITEIVDIKRFKTYDKYHSFIGLVPSTNSSADIEKVRGITNRANKRLRSVLVEAAWIAIQKNTELFHYYHSLKQRMNANKAIIRVAKKLANQVRYTLLELEKRNVAST